MRNESGKTHYAETFGKVPQPLMHDLSITDGAIRLYAHMHWRYGKNKDNHEGQKSMAEILGISEKTVRNRIDELEASDWVITIYQDETTGSNHQYQRCYYHVFELQEDCRRFRQSYKPKSGETIKSKPDARSRKSRKGIGNSNPIIPGRQNSSSDGIQQNLSSVGLVNSISDGQQNLSSDNLDSSYLDSNIQTQDTETDIEGGILDDRDIPGIFQVTAAKARHKITGRVEAVAFTTRTYGKDIVLEAIKIAATKDKHSWDFVAGTARNLFKEKQEQQPYRTMSPAVPEESPPDVLRGPALDAFIAEARAKMLAGDKAS